MSGLSRGGGKSSGRGTVACLLFVSILDLDHHRIALLDLGDAVRLDLADADVLDP